MIRNSMFALLFTSCVHIASATVTISGTSLVNVEGVADGDFVAYVVSTNGSPLESSNFSFASGADLSAGSTYGSSYELVGITTASAASNVVAVSSSIIANLENGITAGDGFGIISFDGTNSSTAIDGAVFRIWTSTDWIIPSDGSTVSFGTSLTQLTGTSASSTGRVGETSQDPDPAEPATPADERPAYDAFPEAQTLIPDGTADSERDPDLEGWVVDPAFELVYLDEDSDWVYSETLGWAFSSPVTGGDGIWFYLADTEQWYWTTGANYPYLYDFTNTDYVYIAEENGVRFLYDFDTDAWRQISN